MDYSAIKNFNVIIENNGQFESYDIMPTLIRKYKECKREKPVTHEEFLEFVKKESMYHWWAKCEYEIILSDWPGRRVSRKIDIHAQVMMNHELVTRILEANVLKK